MAEPKMTPEEARLDLLWYLADCIWYFFGNPEGSVEDGEDELEVCQGIALAIAEATGMKITDILDSGELVLTMKLSEDAQEAVKKFLSGT
jgi:hypothetical protein